jgi:hypothetical protein
VENPLLGHSGSAVGLSDFRRSSENGLRSADERCASHDTAGRFPSMSYVEWPIAGSTIDLYDLKRSLERTLAEVVELHALAETVVLATGEWQVKLNLPPSSTIFREPFSGINLSQTGKTEENRFRRVTLSVARLLISSPLFSLRLIDLICRRKRLAAQAFFLSLGASTEKTHSMGGLAPIERFDNLTLFLRGADRRLALSVLLDQTGGIEIARRALGV